MNSNICCGLVLAWSEFVYSGAGHHSQLMGDSYESLKGYFDSIKTTA